MEQEEEEKDGVFLVFLLFLLNVSHRLRLHLLCRSFSLAGGIYIIAITIVIAIDRQPERAENKRTREREQERRRPAAMLSPQSFERANAMSMLADSSSGGGPHPSIPHLALLVFEAVLEVVCVSLPGYIIARMGMFDAESQKFVANLNVMLFTPCLIFTKLASQLTAGKLADLAVIPVLFTLQTLVSYTSAMIVSRCFGFRKRQANFVKAMGVFGNSNSLPISLVISLSKTLSGLHWDKIPNDNDNEVAARGILYLLIFQQLGQAVRWSWGYHVLLAPREAYLRDEEEAPINAADRYRDDPEDGGDDSSSVGRYLDEPEDLARTAVNSGQTTPRSTRSEDDSSPFESGSQTPLAQICQINNVYMGAMSRILFHSYVIWILPSTLILVISALQVVQWAAN
ncbi:auxin Efflux Carrier superfamily protein [Nannizzia gypsea CBS 118893]|uniref:Auxin Efflux Carrier superfamily protein n=1 Tax=Arthroderma gypseum (strain ATCC MYA-4604 / CBS 118893) TaxID=535722 RepID=E4V252_ARTGP|nr:auxin Efflux Carrier superfamily protein [Nannizzia gypsea CBS 118893]EFR04117.1 auxin Efflux Carrier superfamily protein [Nannizzia gypsea CBS 118893]